ncbi:hypothetical protein PG984_016304 [Apiospora sp. TS-2023a]
MTGITSTAHSMPWVQPGSGVDPEFFAPPVQVGTGLVDAARAMSATTELSFHGRGFELKDPTGFLSKHSVNITNVGSKAVTYSFELQGAGGFDSRKHLPGDQNPHDPVVPTHLDPLVTLPKAVTVGVGKTKEVK